MPTNRIDFSSSFKLHRVQRSKSKYLAVLVTILISLGLSLAPLAALAAAGDLDTSFGFTNGSTASISQLKVQADGKILINAHYNSTRNEFEPGISRLNADGTPDATFQSGLPTGKQVLDFSILANSKIMALVAGEDSINTLVSLNANGSLDDSYQFGVSFKNIKTFYVQPDGKILIGGSFSNLVGNAPYNFIARVNTDGTLDTTYPHTLDSDSSRFGAGQEISYITPQADGKFLVGGLVTTLVRLNADGTKDTGFSPFIIYNNPPTSGTKVTSKAAVQADGKILVAGIFNTINQLPRNGFARLNSDGSVDSSFDVAINFDRTSPTPPASIVVQPDNKILVAGNFTTVNGLNYKSLVRLNADGTIDSGFTPPAIATSTEQIVTLGPAANNKILVGGPFKALQGMAREGVARLDANGAVDNSFNAYQITTRNLVNGEIKLTVIQLDGNLLISGDFTEVDGIARPGFARVTINGTPDNTFQPAATYNPRFIGVQPSGKIIVVRPGGAIIRLNNDGTLDNAFPELTVEWLYSFAMQPDGKFLVGTSDDAARLVRYTEDGQVDSSFNAQITGLGNFPFFYRVLAITPQPDGKLLIGGEFELVSGQPRKSLARLNSNGSLDTSFTPTLNISGLIYKIVVDNTGKIWVAGSSVVINASKGLVKLTPDGAVDTSFVAPTPFEINDFAVQTDGKPVVSYGESSSPVPYYFRRLTTTGSIDATFVANPAGRVSSIALYPNGKIVVGGSFQTVNSVRRNYLARLLNDVIASGFSTQTTLSSSDNRAAPGANVTLTAKVKPATASGTITFSDGNNVLATVPLLNGVATYSTSSLNVGLHKIKASYDGDGNFAAGVAPVLYQRITPGCSAGVDPTVITSATDDGTATQCGTLSYALALTDATKPLSVNLGGAAKTITLSGEIVLGVAPGIQLDGGACGSPALVINGNGVNGEGLRLAGNNLLRNVQISGFSANQIATGGVNNRFECVRVF